MVDMDKNLIIEQIKFNLSRDLKVLLDAARNAHSVATHSESVAKSPYETMALESSYIAQSQANRADEIKEVLTVYQNLKIKSFSQTDSIDLTALVTIEPEDEGENKTFFLGPACGGMKIEIDEKTIFVITSKSPIGSELIGKELNDDIDIKDKEFVIIGIE
jgi:transcription elongation GreA/GreB family factor